MKAMAGSWAMSGLAGGFIVALLAAPLAHGAVIEEAFDELAKIGDEEFPAGWTAVVRQETDEPDDPEIVELSEEAGNYLRLDNYSGLLYTAGKYADVEGSVIIRYEEGSLHRGGLILRGQEQEFGPSGYMIIVNFDDYTVSGEEPWIDFIGLQPSTSTGGGQRNFSNYPEAANYIDPETGDPFPAGSHASYFAGDGLSRLEEGDWVRQVHGDRGEMPLATDYELRFSAIGKTITASLWSTDETQVKLGELSYTDEGISTEPGYIGFRQQGTDALYIRDLTVIPEPGTTVLVLLAAGALLAARSRRPKG